MGANASTSVKMLNMIKGNLLDCKIVKNAPNIFTSRACMALELKY
jgi:hypothetical protein